MRDDLTPEACREWSANQRGSHIDDENQYWIESTWLECLNRHNKAVKKLTAIFKTEESELRHWERKAFEFGWQKRGNACYPTPMDFEEEIAWESYLKTRTR